MKYKLEVLSQDKIDECTELYCNVFNRAPWNDGWDENDAKERLSEIFNNNQ